MQESPLKRVLLIAGPTASGKSALAIAEAQNRNGVIINADSMQVYRELRVLTARPSAADLAMAPHRLYGHVAGADDYSTGRWLTDATREIEAAWAQGVLPIVCGGTGLYFKALLEGLATVPAIPQEVREKWRAYAGDIYGALAVRDPAMAILLKPQDRQRISRALEVIDTTGESLLAWQERGRAKAYLNNCDVERWFMDVPREVLYARAEQRFDGMLDEGALDEVRCLPRLSPQSPLMKAIGVPEFMAHLRGEMALDVAITLAKTATRQYIKRQLTWWRGQMKGWESVAAH
jgi:tRNA dimethylallyltransferase